MSVKEDKNKTLPKKVWPGSLQRLDGGRGTWPSYMVQIVIWELQITLAAGL
jgi:hypothetical protein